MSVYGNLGLGIYAAAVVASFGLEGTPRSLGMVCAGLVGLGVGFWVRRKMNHYRESKGRRFKSCRLSEATYREPRRQGEADAEQSRLTRPADAVAPCQELLSRRGLAIGRRRRVRACSRARR